jgi:hypothetical protein
VWFTLCLSLEYLLTPHPFFWCWNHCSSVYFRIVFRSCVEYHFQGRMQLSCSVQFRKGCSKNLLASEKRRRKSRHVSHHDFGVFCWFGRRIFDCIGSRMPSYAAWVILLPPKYVISESDITRRNILHALIWLC